MLVTRYKKSNEESCFKVKPYVPVVYYEKSTKKDTTLVDFGEWLSTRIHGGYLKLSFYYWPELFTFGPSIRAHKPLLMLDAESRGLRAYRLRMNADAGTAGAVPPSDLEARRREVERLQKAVSMQHARLDVLPLLMDELCRKRVTDAQCTQFLNDAILNEQLLCRMYANQINAARCMPWMYGP